MLNKYSVDTFNVDSHLSLVAKEKRKTIPYTAYRSESLVRPYDVGSFTHRPYLSIFSFFFVSTPR